VAEIQPQGGFIAAGYDSNDKPANLQMSSTGALQVVGEVASYAKVEADGVVKGSAGTLYGLVCIASNSGTIILYNHASTASGDKLFEKALTAGDVVHFGGVGIAATNGIYADVGGTSITVNVLYK